MDVMTPSLTSLDKLARGAVREQFAREMQRVSRNILDPNTKATAKRSIAIKVTFAPTEDRGAAALAIEARSTLAPDVPVTTMLLLDRAAGGQVVASEVGRQGQVPGQLDLEGGAFEPARMGLTVVD